MAKRLTKTETKRLYAAILSKTKRLWLGYSLSGTARHRGGVDLMSTADMVAIEKIIHKYQKKQ